MIAFEDHELTLQIMKKMLARTARKRLSRRLGEGRVTKQYVVSPYSVGDRMYLTTVLKDYPQVVLLDRLGDSTALLEMTDRDCLRMSRQHPELAIEPNAAYKKIGYSSVRERFAKRTNR